MSKKTLLLIGGGHAHIQVVLSLSDLSSIRRVLVSDTPSAVYSGLLPSVVAGLRPAVDAEVDLRALCRAYGWTFVVGRVVSLDPSRNRATVQPATGARMRLAYDVASLDVGSRTRPVPGAAPTGERLPMILATRPIGRLAAGVDAFEQLVRTAATKPGAPAVRDVLVAGGGAAGAEVAFALQSRLADSLHGLCKIRVTLVAPRRTLDGQFGHALGSSVRGALRGRGIVRVSGRVTRVDAPGIAVIDDAGERTFDLLAVATGAAAHSWLSASSGLPVDGDGFVSVEPSLQTASFPNVFATGDCASFGGRFGKNFPPKAGVYAVRQGPVLANNLRVAIEGEGGMVEYAPQSKFLTLLSTGDGRAIGSKYGIAFSGTWVYHLKSYIDDKWQRRFAVPLMADAAEAVKRRFAGTPEEGAACLLAASDVGSSDAFDEQLAVLERMDADKEFRRRVVDFAATKDFDSAAPAL